MKVYQKISQLLNALNNCEMEGNYHLSHRYRGELEAIHDKYLQHEDFVSAYIDMPRSNRDKIVICFTSHENKEDLLFNQLLDLTALCVPSFTGVNVSIKWYGTNDQYKVRKYKPILNEFLNDMWMNILNTKYQEIF